ncbi:potassium channel family protein [Aliiroseovarius sp. S2029]|uniref:potassium channel family protein n=1 Tax=Aliiroseovarius sp. S2029 TaxID=2936988 RepID=UPI0020C038E7|nr:potassium channel family protein [Aliiroseovarius sp. S2029]
MLSFALALMRFAKAVLRSWNDQEFRACLALALLMLVSGTIFYNRVEGWTWIDALYFSVTTMSTVGFGDLSPQTNAGKIFTVFYILVGVGIFVSLFTFLARALLQSPDVDTEGSDPHGSLATRKD